MREKTIEELMELLSEKIEETHTLFYSRGDFLKPYHECEEIISVIEKKSGQRHLKLRHQLNDAVDDADVEGYENLF